MNCRQKKIHHKKTTSAAHKRGEKNVEENQQINWWIEMGEEWRDPRSTSASSSRLAARRSSLWAAKTEKMKRKAASRTRMGDPKKNPQVLTCEASLSVIEQRQRTGGSGRQSGTRSNGAEARSYVIRRTKNRVPRMLEILECPLAFIYWNLDRIEVCGPVKTHLV